MNAPLYTKTALVFDRGVLWRGRPVKLSGHDEVGERLKGTWLVRDCEMSMVHLVNEFGDIIIITIDEATAPEFPAIIIPYPEVKDDEDPRTAANPQAEGSPRVGQA